MVPGWILSSDISPEVETVIAGMQTGPERLVVKNDRVMHMLAAKLLSRVAHSRHHINYIRSRLRTLARLLIELRRTDLRLKSADLQATIAPKFFRSVVQAVQTISGYDSETHTYKAPSLAIRLGQDLRKCAQLVRSAAIEKEDGVTADKALKFNELCATEWNNDVGGTARRVLQDRKLNRRLLLPLAADVSKLTCHLKESLKSNVAIIQKKNASTKFDASFVEAFKSLTEALLAALILFNRRRQGEVSRLTVTLYHNAKLSKQSSPSSAPTSMSSSDFPLKRDISPFSIAISTFATLAV